MLAFLSLWQNAVQLKTRGIILRLLFIRGVAGCKTPILPPIKWDKKEIEVDFNIL